MMHTRTVFLALALLAATLWASPAAAQTGTGHGPSQPVTIVVEQFGLGGVFRPGGHFGIRLALTDSADKPRAAVVVLHLPDPDGDTMLAARQITLNPGRPLGLWLYGQLPWKFGPSQFVQISVHEAPDGASVDEAASSGRLIGATRVTPQSPNAIADDTHGLMGVVGASAPGLEQYEMRTRDTNITTDFGHEPIRVVSGILPETLPDDWRGMAAMEAIVWTEGDPLRLEGDRPGAIREWVRRGGHLVVMVPSFGSAWFNDTNPLRDLMPAADITRHEDADLSAFRHWLTTPEFALRAPRTRGVVHSFQPVADAEVGQASCIIEGPYGCIAMRRIVGAGMVTVIGLDLTNRRLTEAIPVRADMFWHRILGKRFSLPTMKEQGEIAQQGGGFSRASTVFLDRSIGSAITQVTAAGVGVLLGVVVFALYWIVAGPGGFAVLKARGLVRHAWVGFALTTAAFTAVAWAGATWIKPRRIIATHLTFLDHVYGQPTQAARTWASILLPGYGDATVFVGRAGADESFRQSILPWADPTETNRRLSFPDARSYAADIRRPDRLSVPTRATNKQFIIDWAGGPTWSMPQPVSDDERPRLIRRGGSWSLSGSLVHNLPDKLVNVRVFLVVGQISEQQGAQNRQDRKWGSMHAETYSWGFERGIWEPGQVMPLSIFNRPAASAAGEAILRALVPTTRLDMLALDEFSPVDLPEMLSDYERMSFASMLQQPAFERSAGTTGQSFKRVVRRAALGPDLGRWFTQPCIIITGVIEGPTPVPLSILSDDTLRPIPSTGRTVVRWVYPLEPAPPVFAGTVQINTSDAKQPAATPEP